MSKKDITAMALTDRSTYEYEISSVNNLLDNLFALTIKDLYNYSYDLKIISESDVEIDTRTINRLKREIKAIISYFDSPFYTNRFNTDKSVWLEWIAKAINKPRININKIVDIATAMIQ